MMQMARDFHRHVNEWNLEPDLVRRLMPENEDIEDLIEKLDNVTGTAESLKLFGLAEDDLQRAHAIQAEVEWYVQHTCERITPELSFLLWGSLLRDRDRHEIVVATTNYDRAVELAANRLGFRLRDGFADFGAKEIAEWSGFNPRNGFVGTGEVTLLKLHGSTDWYDFGGTGKPVKLRHPMPLFGRGSLKLPSLEEELTAALILPSREKRVSHPPYLRLSQVFLNSIDQVEIAVFVGSSFRDPHIQQAVVELANVRPTFVVNPRTIPKGLPSSAIVIPEIASRFLISTLPRALASADPVSALKAAAEDPSAQTPVLSLLDTAMNNLAPPPNRRDSIELLAKGVLTN